VGGGRADPSVGYPRQDDCGRPDTGRLQETEDTTGVNHAPVAAAKAVDFGSPGGLSLACSASRPSRLGAASSVSWLDVQVLVVFADEVLGGWGLRKEWRQELVREGGRAS
jgi:hypothetical protein